MEYTKTSIPKPEKWKDAGTPIYENPVYKIPSPEKQKFEEIKQIALRMFLRIPVEQPRNLPECWRQAERFYEYAKEKEKEGEK